MLKLSTSCVKTGCLKSGSTGGKTGLCPSGFEKWLLSSSLANNYLFQECHFDNRLYTAFIELITTAVTYSISDKLK